MLARFLDAAFWLFVGVLLGVTIVFAAQAWGK